MAVHPCRRPPAPPPAERAKSVLSRPGPVVVAPTAVNADPIALPCCTVRHAHPDGVVSLLVEDRHPLVAMVQESDGGLAALTELADVAPVALREPVRALLWLTGRLSAPAPAQARALAVGIAETDPDERLLDLGHGTTMLLIHPEGATVVDGEGSHGLELAEFAAAGPDPFSRSEPAWLCHLEHQHPDALSLLSRHLPQRFRRGRLRPLGLDRFGLRLRVEAPDGDYDVRLAFDQPARTERDLSVGIRKLIGCPFLRRSAARRTHGQA